MKRGKTKDKEKIRETAREKWHVTYKGKPVWMTADFPSTWRPVHGGQTVLKRWKKYVSNLSPVSVKLP